MLLCLSHTRTLTLLDELGADYDEKIKLWQANLAHSLEEMVSKQQLLSSFVYSQVIFIHLLIYTLSVMLMI